VSSIKNLFHRLAHARLWIVLQFVLTLALILLVLAWTRLPDKHLWQVALSLLIPLLLAMCALELQAATIRAFADDDGKRVKLVWGAVTLLVWIAVGAAFWAFLDWCDDQFPLWAGYLNSRFSAHARVTIFTYVHILRWLAIAEWVLRWIALPAKLIPYGAASSQWGWRIPWRRVLPILWNWRWWLPVVLAALVAVFLPGKLFSVDPKGSVTEQVWSATLKLAVTYILAMGTWVLLLGWVVTLFGRQQRPTEKSLAAVPVEIPPPDDTPRQ
jgi:hypothetical protein